MNKYKPFCTKCLHVSQDWNFLSNFLSPISKTLSENLTRNNPNLNGEIDEIVEMIQKKGFLSLSFNPSWNQKDDETFDESENRLKWISVFSRRNSCCCRWFSCFAVHHLGVWCSHKNPRWRHIRIIKYLSHFDWA